MFIGEEVSYGVSRLSSFDNQSGNHQQQQLQLLQQKLRGEMARQSTSSGVATASSNSASSSLNANYGTLSDVTARRQQPTCTGCHVSVFLDKQFLYQQLILMYRVKHTGAVRSFGSPCNCLYYFPRRTIWRW